MSTEQIYMNNLKFNGSHIRKILTQAETCSPVVELCWEHSISSATFYNSRSKYGGIGNEEKVSN